MNSTDDKYFLILVVVVLSITMPWTIPIWIGFGLLIGILYLVAEYLEYRYENKKKTQQNIPAPKEVSDEDFENAVKDWNKNRRRGNIK